MITWSDPGFSAVLAGGYLGLMSLTWSGLALGVGRWGTGHRLDAQEPTPAELPLLSICIPARNEEGKIGAAVRSALTQDHPNFEVLVVEDRRELLDRWRPRFPEQPRELVEDMLELGTY